MAFYQDLDRQPEFLGARLDLNDALFLLMRRCVTEDQIHIFESLLTGLSS